VINRLGYNWGVIRCGCRGLRVDRGSLIGDLSNVSIDVISGVLDSLDTAIRKGDLVGSRYYTIGIASLSGIEVSL